MVEKFRVIRDTREKEGFGWTFDPSDVCVGTDTRTLKTGDYSLEGHENDFVIERKRNAAEIAQNIQEKRFVAELDRLTTFKKSIIVCEFTMDEVMRFPRDSGIPKHKQFLIKITGEYILKKLMEYQIKYPTHILFAGTHGKAVSLSLMKRFYEQS